MMNFLLAQGELTSVDKVANGIANLVTTKILGPVFVVIGVAAVIYAIILGINYAKAEDADARKKVQGRLIGALIGAVIIIAGATLCFAIKWESIFTDFSGESLANVSALLAVARF